MTPSREEMIKEVLAVDPDDPMVHFTLGNLYLEEERYEEAAEAFRRAVELDAEYSAAWLGLGSALVGCEDEEQAREVLTQAIAVATQNGDLKVKRDAFDVLEQLDEF